MAEDTPTDLELIEPPNWTRHDAGTQREDIARAIGAFDNERTVLEEMAEYSISYKKNARIDLHDVARFVYNKGLPGFALEVNVRTYAKRVAKKLVESGYARVEEGTPSDPLVISLSKGGEKKKVAKESKSEQGEVKNLIDAIHLVDKMYDDIHNSAKMDIPFPTEGSLKVLLKEKFGSSFDPEPIFRKATADIMCEDFTNEFINKNNNDDRLIRVNFDSQTHILVTSDALNHTFQDTLTRKVLDYVSENQQVQDRIKYVLKKNSKESPDIKDVFNDIGQEISFYWLLTFKRIMEYLHQHKGNPIYLHFWQAASLLYQYSMNKRGVQQKEEEKKSVRELDQAQIVKSMMERYEEPWTLKKIMDLPAHTSGSRIGDIYSRPEIEEIIREINHVPGEGETIPKIMMVRTAEEVYYFHKYRFPQFFLYQMEKESNQLKEYYVRTWASDPRKTIRVEEDLNVDIKDRMSPFFSELVFRTIPDIFSRDKPQHEIFPDMIFIKNYKLHKTELADQQRQKIIYEALLKNIFEKNSFKIQPLYSLLKIEIKELIKLSKNFAVRNVPFYKRGVIGALFGWLFRFFEGMQAREKLRELVGQATTLTDLNELLEEYSKHPAYNYLKKIVDAKKKSIQGIYKDAQKKEKDAEKAEQKAKLEERRKKLDAIKTYFLKGRSIDEMLDEYERQWNTRIGAAEQETKANVGSAVSRMMRQVKNYRLTKDEITTLAARFVNDRALASIQNREMLTKYIELYILKKLMSKIRV